MNNGVKENSKMEITFATLLKTLKKFVILIVVATVLLGAAMGVYAKFFTKTRYSATIEFVVVNVLDENPYISDSMLGAASDITATCVEIVNKNVLLNRAVEEHSLEEVYGLNKHDSVNKIAGMISAKQSAAESSVFSVNVTSEEEQITYKTIRAIQDVMPRVVEELYKITDSSLITTTIKPVTVVDELTDVQPVNTSMVKFMLIGALAGFVLSFGVALILFITDTKVYDENTLKSTFDVPIVGSIPEWMNSAEDGTASSKKKRSEPYKGGRDYKGKLLNSTTPFGVTEAFNSLRTNICYSTSDEKCPIFAVTSDFSGAGKSVISSNLAISLSMLGKKTLLLECDLRRPELERIFSIDSKFGLSDYLAGEVRDASSVLTSSVRENLDVIFSGRIPPNPSELLGSETMRNLIDDLKEKYDVIIIDTPPAFDVSDIGMISSFVSGIVMVARSRYSDLSALKASIEMISGVNGKIVGFVVNDVNYKDAGYYKKNRYGYRKYKKYGRYGRYYKYSYYTEKNEGDK